jgi:hypothetical protein
MDQPQSQAEIARRLLTEIRSLIYNFPEHTKGQIELIKTTLGSPSQKQILVSALIGIAFLFQVYIKFVSPIAAILIIYIYIYIYNIMADECDAEKCNNEQEVAFPRIARLPNAGSIE